MKPNLLLLALFPPLLASCNTRDIASYIFNGGRSDEQQSEGGGWGDVLNPSADVENRTDPTLVLWAELEYLREAIAAGRPIDRTRLDQLIAKIDALAAKHGQADSEITKTLSDAKLAALSIGAETMPDRYSELRNKYFRSLFQMEFDPSYAANESVKRFVTEYLGQAWIDDKALAMLDRHITSYPDCEMNVELYVTTVERLSNERQVARALQIGKEGLQRCAAHDDIHLLESRLDQIQSEHPGQVGTRMRFTSTTLRGSTFDLKSLRGKPVLVTFWATWCPGCCKEAPVIAKLRQRYRGNGLEVVSVSMDSDREKLAEFVAANGMDWPQMFSPNPAHVAWNNPIAKHFQVRSIPSVFLLDDDGVIVAAELHAESEIESAILDHLAERRN